VWTILYRIVVHIVQLRIHPTLGRYRRWWK